MVKILAEALKRRKLVLFLSALLLITGVYSYITVPKQEMPDLIVPMATVQVVAPGVSADEINTIGTPINKLLMEYKEVEYVQSIVLDNVMISQVFFDFGVKNTSAIAVEIENDINLLEMNEHVDSIKVRTDFDIPHVVFALSGGDKYTLKEEAKRLSEEILKLNQIDTVTVDASINDYVEVYIPNERLTSISVEEIYGLIFANTQSIPLGSIESNPLVLEGSFDDIEDIRNIYAGVYVNPITGDNVPIRLGDLADISLSTYESKEYFHNGDVTVFLTVLFEENIDFSRSGKELKTLIDDFESDYLITTMNYVPEYVDYQISQAMVSLLLCILIVMVVVFLGLGFRNSLTIAITIPIIVFGTILSIDLLGYKLERVSIAGIIISIGILVDNSIVMSDAIQHFLDQGDDIFASVKKAISQNSIPILASTLTTIAAFIPLMMLPGLAGQMAKSLPVTVMIAIALSYVFSIFVTPVLATYIFKQRKKKRELDVTTFMRWIFKYPKRIIYVTIIMLVTATFFVIKLQPIDIFPADEKSELYINFRSSEPSYEDAHQLAEYISGVLDEKEEVHDYYYSVSGGLPAFSGTTLPTNEVINEGRFLVHTTLDFDDISAFSTELREELKSDLGNIEVKQIELGMASAPVEMYVNSTDLEYLNRVSDNLRYMLNRNEFVESYEIIETSYYDTYQVSVDREALLEKNKTLVELQNFIYVSLNGLSIQAYEHHGEVIDIYIHSDVNSIESMLALEFEGEPLETYIDIYKDEAIETMYLYNGAYQILIKATPNDENAIGLENDIKRYLSNYDVEIELGGDSKLANTIFGDIGQAALIAVLLIYLILFIQFNSFSQPLIVFLTIPLSLIGSFIMMLIFDTPISLMSMLGIVSLVGVVVNTGILLVDYINNKVEQGETVLNACVLSVQRRLRPIVLASLTTVLGLVPMIVSGGDFFAPLAIVFAGGVISTMILTIFVVPSFYIILKRST